MRAWITKHRVASAIFGAVLAASLGAVAAWLISSNVTGYGKATSLQPFTSDDISATVPADLVPGGTAPLHLQLDNPNQVALAITSVAGNGTPTSSVASCGSHVSILASSTLNIPVPASASNFAVDIPGRVSMSAAAPTECQGATFAIPVTLGATT
jgi:hypothetical protein